MRSLFVLLISFNAAHAAEAPGWGRKIRIVDPNVVFIPPQCGIHREGDLYFTYEFCRANPGNAVNREGKGDRLAAGVVAAAESASAELAEFEFPEHVPQNASPSALSYNGRLNFGALKEAALAQGVPAVVYERALAHYRDLRNAGRTSRPCFVAADLTAPEGGAMWELCLGAQVSVKKLRVQAGTGEGSRCTEHAFKNAGGGCARFFGDRPGYCLSGGGRYSTGLARFQQGAQVPVIELIAYESGPAGADGGAWIALNSQSQRAFSIPPTADAQTVWDFSSRAQGGTMPIYVYPAEADVRDFTQKKAGVYWNETCKTQVTNSAWIDDGATDADLLQLAKAEAKDKLRRRMNPAADLRGTISPPTTTN